MIKNKNMVFPKANNSSRDEDKGIQLPKIANASLPTAGTTYEGFIVYDSTNNKVVFCNGSAWETVTSA